MSLLRRIAGIVALLLVAATIRVWTRDLPEFAADPSAGLRGVFHIHSDASHDGRVPYSEMIEAGRFLEVDFLVFTEHNLRPERLQPRGGPIVVSASELSTAFGHLIQLGLDSVPPVSTRFPERRCGIQQVCSDSCTRTVRSRLPHIRKVRNDLGMDLTVAWTGLRLPVRPRIFEYGRKKDTSDWPVHWLRFLSTEGWRWLSYTGGTEQYWPAGTPNLIRRYSAFVARTHTVG